MLQEWELAAPGQGLLQEILFHCLCWGSVFPSPSNEINTFTCRQALRTQLGSFAFPCGVPAPTGLPASPTCSVAISNPLSKEESQCSPPRDPGDTFHQGQDFCGGTKPGGFGKWCRTVSTMGSGDELGAWMECWSGTRGQRTAGGEHICRDTPRLPSPLTVGSQLSITAPWLSLSLCAPEIHPEHSPRPPPPRSCEPRGHTGKDEGGQGGGSMFRPRCFCSQTWQSSAPAAPALASTAQAVFMFPASAPRQPRTAQHCSTTLTLLSWI